MAASTWKGHITFGLISIPVRLYPAARNERVVLHQLHSVCHTRVRQPLYCPTCKRIVERSEIVKGYEYEKGQYVLIDPKEVKKIEPASARTMEIMEFVKLDDVDPIYFDASYYVTPEKAGEKAYQLLLRAMEESGYGAIAKLTMHQREYVVAIRPRGHGLTLHTLYYEDEIRQMSEYGKPARVQIKESEKKLALQLIDTLAAPFEPRKYHDEYRENLRALIAAKQKGEEVAAAPQPKLAPVIDLMEGLKRSLAKRSHLEARPTAHAVHAQKKSHKKSAA